MPDTNPCRHTVNREDWKVLSSISAEHFDGHTEFYRMSPEQRLQWLDDAVDFILTCKTINSSGERIKSERSK